jgi:hypothetical protein
VITVTTIDGNSVPIDLSLSDVVLTLKELLRLRQGIPVQAQQLFSLVEEEPLDNDRPIADIVAQGSELMMILRAETIVLESVLMDSSQPHAAISKTALEAWCLENGESAQALCLKGCVFENVDCLQLIQSRCPCLQSVDFSNVHLMGGGRDAGLDDAALVHVYIQVLKSSDLTEFYARGTRLFAMKQSDKCTADLVACLAGSQSLTTINLSGTHMCSDVWNEEELRCQPIPTPRVRFANTAVALLNLLKANNTLTSLDLSRNRSASPHSLQAT